MPYAGTAVSPDADLQPVGGKGTFIIGQMHLRGDDLQFLFPFPDLKSRYREITVYHPLGGMVLKAAILAVFQAQQFLREHRDAPLVSLYSCPFPVPALCFQYHVACFHCFFSCSSYLIFLLILFTALFIILYRQMPKCNMAF